MMLLITACGSGAEEAVETSSPPESPSIEASSIETESEPPEPEPSPTSVSPSNDAAITGDPEFDFALMLASVDVDTGPASDAELFAAGEMACVAFDSGGDLRLASASTALELPEGTSHDLSVAVALAAAMVLCPDYWDAAYEESQTG